MPTNKGAFKIFTLSGISVYVHWSWFLVAYYVTAYRLHEYSAPGWNVVEYLSLFLIVLTHEFGHQFACRQVGGKTDDIVLWPLGGVASGSAPERPGAQLWTIVGGPLVNVVLAPLLALVVSVAWHQGWSESHSDAYRLMRNLFYINLGLLTFNILPIYPLDGGQILRALLWFPLGRVNSLFAAVTIGFIGTAALLAWAWHMHFLNLNSLGGAWLAVVAAFMALRCWDGLAEARALVRLAKFPRRDGFACPACKAPPPIGELWNCEKCGKSCDAFITQAACPHCGALHREARCLECGVANPVTLWRNDRLSHD